MAQAESTRIGEKSHTSSRNRQHSNLTPHGSQLTTIEMVQMAFEELDAKQRRGITLQAIKKFISTKFELVITKYRSNLIGNYLRGLLADGDLVNVTGKGLVGHFRLVARKRRTRQKTPTARKTRKKHLKAPQDRPVVIRPRGLFSLTPSETEEELPEISAPVRPKPVSALNSKVLNETPLSSQSHKRQAGASDSSTYSSDDAEDMISNRLRSKDYETPEPEKRSKRRLFNPAK